MFRKILFSLILCLTCFAGPLKPPKGMVLNQGRVKGLVGFWLMNEGSGSTVQDLSGNRNTGTFVADTAWIGGKFGPAINIIDEDAVDFGKPSILDSTNAAGTVIVWFNTDSVGAATQMFISNASWGGDRNGFALGRLNANLVYILADNAGSQFATGATTLVANTWYQAVLTWDGTTVKMYLNGIEDYSAAETKNPISNVNNLYLGRDGAAAAFWYVGLLDGVSIYNRALSPSEILKRYKNPFMDFQPEPPMTYMGSVSAAAPAGQVIMIQMSAIPLVLIIGCVLIFSKGKKAT